MSFSKSISAVPADKIGEALAEATITNEDAESQALFAEAKAAFQAVAEKLPKFGADDVFIQGSISGHAAPADGEGSWPYNSINLSVSETAIPKEAVAAAASEDANAANGPQGDEGAAGATGVVEAVTTEDTTKEVEVEGEILTEQEAAEVTGDAETTEVGQDAEPEPEPEAVEDAPVLTGQAARDEAARLAALAEEAKPVEAAADESTGDDAAA